MTRGISKCLPDLPNLAHNVLCAAHNCFYHRPQNIFIHPYSLWLNPYDERGRQLRHSQLWSTDHVSEHSARLGHIYGVNSVRHGIPALSQSLCMKNNEKLLGNNRFQIIVRD